MAYVGDVGSVLDALEALPPEALMALAEVLEVAPWSGDPLVDRKPDGAVRTMSFGSTGLVTYVVVDHAERVDLLQPHWVGETGNRAPGDVGVAGERCGAAGSVCTAVTCENDDPHPR